MTVADSPATAEELIIDALAWLGEHYGEQVFYVERDIVYTVQQRLNSQLHTRELPWTVYNDYPMIPGPRRALSADLAVIGGDGAVLVAVEFKYEPCHRRGDVLKNKLPVTSWSEIVKDTMRVRDFVAQGIAPVAYAVVIDEGGYLARRDLTVYATGKHGTAHPTTTMP